MSEEPGNSKPYDPLEPFRGMRDAYLDAMAKTMVEAVNTDAYAQASGAMLDSTLTMSAPFREAIEKSMLQVLQQLSLPSRQDIIALAERFTNLEMRLDDMDASLDSVRNTLEKSMLPILQQLVLLTQRFTDLTRRLDALDGKTTRQQKRPQDTKAASKPGPVIKAKVQPAAPTPAKARAPRKSTKSTQKVAKGPRTRRVARRGAK
jgi:polyhydroxyalkanoate synthesis regulator phasin